MKYTSSEANKLLKKLNADYQTLLSLEAQSRTFLAATGEDIESVRPAYDYAKTQADLKALAKKIRQVRHAISLFNVTTTVPGFDMTVDELLVYLPQLSERVNTLDGMRTKLPKERERTYGSGTMATIDYRYVNYDLDVVNADYDEAYALLAKAQTALDRLNNTSAIEIDF